MTAELRAALDGAVRGHDRSAAVAITLDAIDAGVPIPDVYGVLSGILVDLGSQWQAGTAEVWQEHLATGIVRTVVEACAPLVDAAAPPERTATIVLAAPGDEYHDLGLRMAADRFVLAGWRAHFLGGHVPVTQVMAAVDALGADAVALSASTHYHRVTLRHYVDLLGSAHPGIRIWVGGPAFAHEHDGWPDDMVLGAAVPAARRA